MWQECYSLVMKQAIILYNLDTASISSKIGISDTALRQWLTGRNFPSKSAADLLYTTLEKAIDAKGDIALDKRLYVYAVDLLSTHGVHIDPSLNALLSTGQLLVYILKLCYTSAKTGKAPKIELPDCSSITQIKETRAVVFDFDGTLTEGNTARTTWETIWIELGCSIEECRELHKRFNLKEITHTEWCKRTTERFREKGFHKSLLSKIADDIRLIPGCEETFRYLSSKNIKMYIVSGSILFVIQNALKGLYYYFDSVKANDMVFSSDGFFSEIIGTEFDFEGKATYITEISRQLGISTSEILFIGNSYNDKYTFRSGAQTLCINPRNTDPSDYTVWNNCIYECTNLFQISDYIV